MRLEVDQNAPDFSSNVNADEPSSQEKFAEFLNAGIKAAQAGDRKAARRNLMAALDLDAQSENAWLWLASISEYPEELLVFLNNVLDINPKNERALQWSASTKLLLSKTLVQRGIDAYDNGRRDFAGQCFDQALSYDVHNLNAWLWLAALAENEDRRIEYFRRALEIDPENQTAKEAIQAAEAGSRSELFATAAKYAADGDRESALKILEEFLERWPDDKKAWTMKSHLVTSFEEKRSAWNRLLNLDPEDRYAAESIASLSSVAAWANEREKSATDAEEQKDSTTVESTPVAEPDVTRQDEQVSLVDDFVPDEYPTVDAFAVPQDVIESVGIVDEPRQSFDNELVQETDPVLSEQDDPFSTPAQPFVTEAEVVDDRQRILVVENNPIARKLMADKLERSGYNVTCAETGRQAVEMAAAIRPSLVLADIAMPGLDGYAICRTLRDRSETNNIPVVLISGKDATYEAHLGEAAGASGFIAKPYGPETLMKIVAQFIADAAPN
jgi:CheY-like chemotaxis protein